MKFAAVIYVFWFNSVANGASNGEILFGGQDFDGFRLIKTQTFRIVELLGCGEIQLAAAKLITN